MVQRVRQGWSARRVAKHFHVALRTVQRWVERAADQRLDRVDWTDHSSRPRRLTRVSAEIEDMVLDIRRQLYQSPLGEVGALAIYRHLLEHSVPLLGPSMPPSVRTIGRILARRGVLDGRARRRRPPPPSGWYLPPLAAGRVELDAFDVIEGLSLDDGADIQVLTAVSLHGRLLAAWPRASILAVHVVEALLQHWRKVGLPAYAQFDNDTRFQGPHNQPDALGRVLRLCLGLGVTPVFVPPRETGFQAAIESFNGLWQRKVWARCSHATLQAVQDQSQRYIEAAWQRHASRIETAPPRRPFPRRWRLDLQAPPMGQAVFLRRTGEHGQVNLLGHTFQAAADWPRRLVRAEVDFANDRLRFYALRRREPQDQPLLSEHDYRLPQRPFREESWRTIY
jgi:hypothetical protein